ncbi:MAG: YidC/Oxa1 family membrane protein insertase [Patescibacteria group bacterium]|nr:YidC/Oxa1 family membrane protein insertase [Patescibacteria group bacterium]
MINQNFFNNFFVIPTLNILVFIYKGLSFLKIPGALGWAIIGLTVLIRLLLHPFFKQQMETSKKLQELKPHLDKLAKKHKNDQKKLQQEQLRLYQQAGINPASGCLLMIIQIPVFIGLYNTLSLFLLNGSRVKVIDQINRVLYFSFLKITSIDSWFFGFNLALTPAKAGVWYYYLIPLLTAFLQYKQNQSLQTAPKPTEVVNKVDKSKDDEDDFQKALNTQMKFLFPLMIGWFSYSLPVGLSLYWNIFSLFSIVQYKKLTEKKVIS